jgi:hypothetical protein
VLRAKGFVRLAPDGALYTVQMAGRRIAWTPAPDNVESTGLVLIGVGEMPALQVRKR